MNTSTFTAIAVAFSAIATAAHAQGFRDGQIGLSYGVIDIDNVDDDFVVGTAAATADFEIAPQFGLQASGSISEYDYGIEDVDYDLDTASVELLAYYQPSPDVKIGGFVGYVNLGDLSASDADETASVTLDLGTTTYGLAGRVDSGPIGFEGRFGMGEVEDSDEFTYTVNFVQLSAEVALTPSWELYGSFTRTDFDVDDAFLVDSRMTMIGARYYVGGAAFVSAGIGTQSLGDLDGSRMSLGLTWPLGEARDPQTHRGLFSSYESPL